MESNWRYNVALWSYAKSDWELCARISGSSFLAVLIVKRKGSPKVWKYQASASAPLPTLASSYDPPTAHPTFPWGENVIAD